VHPRRVREALLGQVARATEKLMGPRTMEIDDGLCALPPGHQVVLLGAGFDARAYRTTELSQSVAFEVDYPSTQAFKRRLTEGLRPVTRELRPCARRLRERTNGRRARARAPSDRHSDGVGRSVTFESQGDDIRR
jgi:O-methyltransferase involved in polyketide biosynthesis